MKFKSNNQIYTLYPASCEIRLGNSIVLNTSLLPDPQINGWVGGQSGALEFPSLINRLNISMNSQTIIPSTPSISFRAAASLSNDVLMLISKEFEGDPSTDRLPLRVEVRIPALLFVEENRQTTPKGGLLLKFILEYQYSRRDWLQWTRAWGYQTTLMYLPTDVQSRIKELAQQHGYTKEWEVVSMSIRNLETLGLNVVVHRGNSSDRALNDRIKSLIASSRKYLYIAVQTIDGTFSDDIAKAGMRKVQLKIIVGPLKSEWKGPRNPIIKALTDLSKHTEIRTKDDWHGRMIIVDDKLIVGSLDLDRQGLIVHDNLVVETDEQTAVQKAKEIFSQIASQSQPLQLPST